MCVWGGGVVNLDMVGCDDKRWVRGGVDRGVCVGGSFDRGGGGSIANLDMYGCDSDMLKVHLR